MQGYIGFRDEGLGFRGGTSLGDVAFWCLYWGPPIFCASYALRDPAFGGAWGGSKWGCKYANFGGKQGLGFGVSTPTPSLHPKGRQIMAPNTPKGYCSASF